MIEKSPYRVESHTPTYIAMSRKSIFMDIVPQLERSLNDMKESGQIEEIEQAFMEKWIE